MPEMELCRQFQAAFFVPKQLISWERAGANFLERENYPIFLDLSGV